MIGEHARQFGFRFVLLMLVAGVVSGALVAWLYVIIVALITDPTTVVFALFMFVFIAPLGAFVGAFATVGGALGHCAASAVGVGSVRARVVAVALGAGIATTVFAQVNLILNTTPGSNLGGLDQFIGPIAVATILSGALFWFALRWRVRHPRQNDLMPQNEEAAR
jgi:hypothetical protein